MDTAVFDNACGCVLKRFERAWQAGITELSELELVRALEAEVHFTWAAYPMLALFQKHFLVRHGLYRAREKLQAKKIDLEITPLGARLRQLYESTGTREPGEFADLQLRAFYLDTGNFSTVTRENVEDWLNNFWTKMAAHNQVDAALEILDLSPSSSWAEIQQRYRQLATQYHPDKGGSAERFVVIREAYESLKLNQQNRSKN